MNNLSEKIKTMINITSIDDVNKVTGSVVKEADVRLKAGKSDVSGSYTSDTILNAPDIFFDHMSIVYRSWLVHGTVSLCLLALAFLPLFKGGVKDPSKTSSYRAIAGASLLLKLFAYVILNVWGELLISDSLQLGYKEKTSTTQCRWLVMEVARRVPPVVIQTLMYVYQEHTAWVRWG